MTDTTHPDYLVIVAEPSGTCVFDRTHLAGLIATYPAIAVQMLDSLSRRLDAAERRVATLTAADGPVRRAEYLLGLPAQAAAGRFRIPGAPHRRRTSRPTSAPPPKA